MSRKLNQRTAKDEPTEATRFSNSAIRKEMIQKAAEQIGHLDREIESLKLALKGIAEDKKDIFTRLKDELGLDRKLFEFTIKHLVNPEPPIRDAIEDCIREVYEALRPGEQLDWVRAADKSAADAAKKLVDGMSPGDSLSIDGKLVVGKDATGQVIVGTDSL